MPLSASSVHSQIFSPHLFGPAYLLAARRKPRVAEGSRPSKELICLFNGPGQRAEMAGIARWRTRWMGIATSGA
jgi:hypothetical protein